MLFVTGSTGFLGREVLKELLRSDDFQSLGLLIRAGRGESAEERGKQLLRDLVGADALPTALARTRFIPGDITLDRFGLGESDFHAVARSTTSVLHCAASTALNISRADAETVNIRGTAETLRLADLARSVHHSLGCYYYVSTAFVAGDTTRDVGATELNLEGPFRNHYEESKAQSEAMVRSRGGDFPVCIFRPSVVIGNSQTGHTTSFNVLYIPARFVAAGLFRVLPANPVVPCDVVPVDYVAQAMFELMRHGNRSSSCYHLCAGLGRESSPGEILEYLFAVIRERGRRVIHVPAWLPPEVLSKVYQSLCQARVRVKGLERIFTEHLDSLKHILPFIPYMIRNPRFITDETTRDLGLTLAPAPLFTSYAPKVFSYCFDSNWGRGR